VSISPESPVQQVPEQPVLLRVAEFGPPPESGPSGDAGAWRSPVLAGLPTLRPVPSLPVLARPGTARPARPRPALITEAQARGLAGGTARAVLEVLEGRRPVHQLAGMLDTRAVAAVTTMVRGGLRWPVRRATVGTVHVYLPCREAVEACVVFRCDQRSRALAMRFERVRRRWVATAIRIG